MTGCARTCLLWVLGWVAGACAFFFLLREIRYVEPHIWWASGIAGVCSGMAAGYAIGVRGLARERRMLLHAARGATPPDGQWVAVSGAIRSSSPLRAPISGAESVAYEYRITHEDNRSSDASTLLYYDGKALARSTIGSVRLLAVPSLDVPKAKVDRKRAVENAQRYVASTTFETRGTSRDERKGVEAESTSDEGEFRRDREYHGGIDVAGCTFEERHIAQNETVCAFGLYSRERGGLVPHPNWAKPTRIMRGDAATVAAELLKRMQRWKVGATCFAAAAIAAAAVYLSVVGV